MERPRGCRASAGWAGDPRFSARATVGPSYAGPWGRVPFSPTENTVRPPTHTAATMRSATGIATIRERIGGRPERTRQENGVRHQDVVKSRLVGGVGRTPGAPVPRAGAASDRHRLRRRDRGADPRDGSRVGTPLPGEHDHPGAAV